MTKFYCHHCQAEWTLNDLDQLPPHEEAEFHDGVGCPDCEWGGEYHNIHPVFWFGVNADFDDALLA